VSYRCTEAPGRQHGVALITVMLVFVLATLMATQMLRTSYLAIHRTGNLIDSAQARYYALGAEELARQIISADSKSAIGAPAIDYAGEQWASDGLSFDIEDGHIELSIVDMAGRFNLNSVVDAKGKQDPLAVARLQKMLRILEIDPAVASAVADWIDVDDETSRGGSEIAAYAVPQVPNQLLVDASEILVVPASSLATGRSSHRLFPLCPRRRASTSTPRHSRYCWHSRRGPLWPKWNASCMSVTCNRFVTCRTRGLARCSRRQARG
jgi:type II secretory pathway component PulK